VHADTLIQIAEWASKEAHPDVERLPNAPRNIRGELRSTLNQIILKAKTLPPIEYTLKKPSFDRRKWSNKSDTLLKLLKDKRESLAKDLKLSPSLLVTNAVLEELILKNPTTLETMIGPDLLMPWQAEVVGESLLSVLHPKS
jgi:ribonuclease D